MLNLVFHSVLNITPTIAITENLFFNTCMVELFGSSEVHRADQWLKERMMYFAWMYLDAQKIQLKSSVNELNIPLA